MPARMDLAIFLATCCREGLWEGYWCEQRARWIYGQKNMSGDGRRGKARQSGVRARDSSQSGALYPLQSEEVRTRGRSVITFADQLTVPPLCRSPCV